MYDTDHEVVKQRINDRIAQVEHELEQLRPCHCCGNVPSACYCGPERG